MLEKESKDKLLKFQFKDLQIEYSKAQHSN